MQDFLALQVHFAMIVPYKNVRYRKKIRTHTPSFNLGKYANTYVTILQRGAEKKNKRIRLTGQTLP